MGMWTRKCVRNRTKSKVRITERGREVNQTYPGAAAERESDTVSLKWAGPEEAGMEGVGG